MNFRITLMEIKRLKTNLIIAIIAPASYSGLVMVFFVAFAGVMNEVTYLFDNASLQGLLRAFSMDKNTFAYILNFYVAYNGMYVLIMGIAFAAVIGVKLFSEELEKGTYEFIYSSPVSRVNIFISKTMVVIIYLLVLNLTVFFLGFFSIELLKTKSPLIPWLSEENTEIILESVEKDPSKLLDVFVLDDALFYDVIYTSMESEFDVMPNDAEIDSEGISELLTVFILDPDGIFDEVIDNKEKYMKLFDIDLADEAEFLELLEIEKEYYFSAKASFSSDVEVVYDIFKDHPKAFMDQLVDLDNTIEFKDTFDLSDKEYSHIFVYYSLSNFIELSFISFLVMLSVVLFILMLTIVVPRGKFSVGMAIGVSMIFYMLSIISNITEKSEVFKYITPIGYVNMDVMAINYTTDLWSIISMVTIIITSLLVSVIVFRKSNLIS